MNKVFFERARLIIISTVIKFVPFVILIVSMFRGRVLFRFLLTGFDLFVFVFVVATAFCAGCRGLRFPCTVAFLFSLTLGLKEDGEMKRRLVWRHRPTTVKKTRTRTNQGNNEIKSIRTRKRMRKLICTWVHSACMHCINPHVCVYLFQPLLGFLLGLHSCILHYHSPYEVFLWWFTK